MFKKLKLQMRFILNTIITSAICTAVGITGVIGMSHLNEAIHEIGENNLVSVNALWAIEFGMTFTLASERALVNPKIFKKAEIRKANLKQIEDALVGLDANVQLYDKTEKDQRDEEHWKIFHEHFSSWKTELNKTLNLVREKERLKDYDSDSASKLDNQMLELSLKNRENFLSAKKPISELVDAHVQEGKEIVLASIQEARQIDLIMLVVLIASIIVSAVLGMILSSSITKPVKLITDISNRLALGDILLEGIHVSDMDRTKTRGDELGDISRAFSKLIEYLKEKVALAEEIAKNNLNLDVQLSSEQDVLGRSLSTMTQNLQYMVSMILDAIHQITAGSSQVSSASQSLSQGATEQASSLEEISSTMTQISTQTRANAEKATQANQHTQDAKISAEVGKERIETTVSAMKEINSSSQQIAKIIKVIDDIAFQTNLLALNAAVEAARAGTHGKGFAVVADEVRNLASRSAKAAKETADLIESAGKKVENGLQVANESSEAFGEIVGGVAKIAGLVGEIATANSEQAQGVAQVSQALTQIDQVTQQNTAHAEETASASEELSSQAVEVQKIISQFKLKDEMILSREKK